MALQAFRRLKTRRGRRRRRFIGSVVNWTRSVPWLAPRSNRWSSMPETSPTMSGLAWRRCRIRCHHSYSRTLTIYGSASARAQRSMAVTDPARNDIGAYVARIETLRAGRLSAAISNIPKSSGSFFFCLRAPPPFSAVERLQSASACKST